MTILLNDRPHVAAATATLHEVLSELGLAARTGLAVAVNGAVMPRARWATAALSDGDRVLVIQATQGG